MEQLTWTGAFAPFVAPVLLPALLVLALGALGSFAVAFATSAQPVVSATGVTVTPWRLTAATTPMEVVLPGAVVGLVIWAAKAIWGAPSLGTALTDMGLPGWLAGLGVALGFLALGAAAAFVLQRVPGRIYDLMLTVGGLVLLAAILAFAVISPFMGLGQAGILGELHKQFLPVWASMIVIFALSIQFRDRLGLYGKLFGSTIGMVGFGLVLFWALTAIFAGLIVTHDPLSQVSSLKNAAPGSAVPEGTEGGAFYLLGGDNLARDVFSRMVAGSTVVMQIAPVATLFAFMVGITLGLPAAYYGGRFDTVLSFVANLILAFPVILLFYLLVTPEIVQTGLPSFMAVILFLFPLLFFAVLFNSRFYTQPAKQKLYLGATALIGGWLYLSLISQDRTPVNFWPDALDLFDVPAGILIVFVAVVFVNSPTVFRIVRGIAMDVKTRDYVAAATTRGEGAWYIMLWEILPNARGPLIVDFCLRIGYTTILLGTLGFFGLGLPPESPDWGTTINDGRRLLSIYPHPAIVPAMALLTLVLGLNLLADGLREESLKD